ncbi:MAG: ABC transporter permease [Candidatus Moeniiplasma glomeromycotorum]|nr:ABC transporter permease [Candidatus Moeniiplasma glomeromycotorum]MCE8162359.1 ABC transporter permease [Candidatus Moeniiplasma glomeromycotorum]MCE8166283.1 ABC transporter permease [Candidatus Moeniiplasma glomeromycotorum]MCE8166765.1 ABC transporter permease [Candidatus Moeniiplasma glomeromycotorum]
MQTLLPNFLISTALSNGVFGLAITYADLKSSMIMKKIRATPLPQWKVVGGVIIFNTLLSLLASGWVFLMGSLFYHSEVNFTSVNWFYLILAVLLATLLGSLIGFLLGSISPDLRTAGNFAFFINTPSNFLAGIFVPMNILLKNQTLSRIAKFFPYSYPVSIANRAFSHYNPPFIQGSLLFLTYHWPIVFCLIWISGLFLLNLLVYRSQKY